jgi:hypothetical protein
MNFFIRFREIGFQTWCELEEIRNKLNKTVETGTFSELIIAYVSTVLLLPRFILRKLFWLQVTQLFSLAVNSTRPTLKLPILITKHTDEGRKVSWDYEGRTWFYYSHLLAQNYGWKLDYIGKLSVDTVIAHIQELLTSQQLENEFSWAMSEIAYPYDKASKTQKFKPLKRPYWMLEEVREIKKIKILKSSLPVGLVQDVGGMQHALDEKEAKSKETNTSTD